MDSHHLFCRRPILKSPLLLAFTESEYARSYMAQGDILGILQDLTS